MEEGTVDVGGAEAVLNLEPNSSIDICYHPQFNDNDNDDLLLLEIDEKLLPDVLHQRVTLRGEADEDAVLCTPSKTYSLKSVATSNSSFLIPPFSSSPAPILKLSPGNMELTQVSPRLDKLTSLLSHYPYNPHHPPIQSSRFYTWDHLLHLVQASDDELLSGLHSLSAVEIDGYWRIVDPNYMDLILRMLFHNSVLNDWSLHSLIEHQVVTVLESDGFPPNLIRHCLNVYGTNLCPGSMWKLDDKRVCVHFARQILKSGKMKMENFMGEWMKKIPDGIQAHFDMLEGEVLTEKLGLETWVRAFSVFSLPSTPAERFSMLFRERSKWEWKELHPYIRDLNVPGLSSEALLLKYTRRTQPSSDSEPIFSAR